VAPGLGPAATSAGRLAGLLAGYGIMLQLLLRARVPAVERGLGVVTIARWHSAGGVLLVALATAHAALITAGYAAATGLSVGAQLRSLLLHYPYVLLAAVGLVLLGTVVVACARAVRSRLPYEVWHATHLMVYPAVALVFWHQLANGEQFRHTPLARGLWTAAYGLAAAALLRYRLLAPVLMSVRHRLTVTALTPEAPGVVSVHVSGRNLDRLPVAPGQFFRWRFLAQGRWWAANPYSLSAPVRADRLRLTVKDSGGHSREVASLRPGTRVIVEGPGGGFVTRRRRRDKVLLVAGGVGITPVRALFETIPARPHDIALLYRATRSTDLVFGAELAAIAAARQARLEYVLGGRDDVGDPATWGLVRSLADAPSAHDVYVCGPPGFTRAVVAAVRATGVEKRHVHIETFRF
jgi:ferredoxin-NADP reductase